MQPKKQKFKLTCEQKVNRMRHKNPKVLPRNIQKQSEEQPPLARIYRYAHTGEHRNHNHQCPSPARRTTTFAKSGARETALGDGTGTRRIELLHRAPTAITSPPTGRRRRHHRRLHHRSRRRPRRPDPPPAHPPAYPAGSAPAAVACLPSPTPNASACRHCCTQ